MNQRYLMFVLLALMLSACSEPPAPAKENPMINIAGKTIPELADMMSRGELSSVELTRYYLSRIDSEDGQYRSVIAVNPEALEQAALLDDERQSGDVRGLMHGIPVLLKDNIESREQPTTAGSLALADNETLRDAPIVRRLRDAGALILGKTNLSEWANFRSERSSSGWSAVGGQTGNAHDVTRSPCGSSAGSGVAVALGFATAAVGTETNGSVVCPASINGIVGVKPTVGLLSRTHIVPISNTQDTAGPMTTNVTDAAILLAVMQGPDAADAATADTGEVADDYYLPQMPSLEGARLGVIRTSVGHPRVQALLASALEVMEEAGATLIEVELDAGYREFRDDTYNILLYEFRHTIADYLGSLDGVAVATLDDLIAFNEANADVEMPYFGQEIFEKSRDLAWTESDYEAALERVRNATRTKGIDHLMATHELDAIIAPSNGPSWKIDLVNGDRGVGGFSTFAAVSGYPHVTLPMGLVHDLPIGLSLVGGSRTERRLIELAMAAEKLIKEAP